MQRAAGKRIATAILVGGLAIATDLVMDEGAGPAMNAPLSFAHPQFEVAWLRDELHLSGHTLSLQHEQDLRQVAARSFPDRPVITAFEPLGTVPAYWQDTTLQVLYTLAATSSARATLTAGHLRIRGVAADDIAWRNRSEALRTILPAAISLSADAIVVERVDPATVCRTAFAGFEVGPINFEESSALFRSSAYPRLDRLTAIATACRDTPLTITGHTDASGSEAWNKVLSLKRANAVAGYLANGGIDRARLRVTGAGSSVPVADNETRYGRGLNRRIEIAFEDY